MALFGILFGRRIVSGPYLRQAAACPRILTRCTEIRQHRGTVRGAQQDVCRFDVPVQYASLMHLHQPRQQRQQDGLQFLFCQCAAPLERIFQGFSLDILHDNVGGAVRLKKMLHLHDVGMLETGHHPGLVQEPFQSPIKKLLIGGGLWRDGPVLFAYRPLRRQVLLDGDRHVQRNIPAQVGDAETAMSQHPVKCKALYPCARRQSHAMVF